MRRTLAVLATLLTLVGCTEYRQYWAKPGGSEADFAVDASHCEDQAVHQYPPVSLGLPGYFPNQQTWCTPTSGGPNCQIINPGYLPQATSSADRNAGPREGAFGECMLARGWRPYEPYALGPSGAPPPGPVDVSLDAALRYCERQFRTKPNTPWTARLDDQFNSCVAARTQALNGARPPG